MNFIIAISLFVCNVLVLIWTICVVNTNMKKLGNINRVDGGTDTGKNITNNRWPDQNEINRIKNELDKLGKNE